jgi:hypothetical protein
MISVRKKPKSTSEGSEQVAVASDDNVILVGETKASILVSRDGNAAADETEITSQK